MDQHARSDASGTKDGSTAAARAAHEPSHVLPTVERGAVTVLPVRSGRAGRVRVVGAFVITESEARWQPAYDVSGLAAAAAGGAVAATLATFAGATLLARQRRQVGTITMGPGGWVSLRSKAGRPAQPADIEARPWWAVLLGAHPAPGSASHR